MGAWADLAAVDAVEGAVEVAANIKIESEYDIAMQFLRTMLQ